MIRHRRPGLVLARAEEVRIHAQVRVEEAITVEVNEPIGGDWRMLESSFPAQKSEAFAARFNVPVEANGEAVLKYRVRVKW